MMSRKRQVLVIEINFVQVIQKIIGNFFLRNIVVFFIFRSPTILQDLSVYKPGDINDMLLSLSSYACMYIYFIFHNRVLYENFLAKKKYAAYALLFLVTMVAWRESSSYVQWLLVRDPSDTVYQFRELKEFNAVFWIFIYWANVVYTYIAFGVYLAFKFFNERARLLQVENEQKSMELNQLNSQLNPHFLFNALNNIYSHQLRSSADGKELILKLSELMRYILDSSKKPVVSLNEELAFIENYIAFEKERLGERCEVVYHKDVQSTEFRIVPLILFNLIENAFKHGTASMTRSEVAISIKADEHALLLHVSNPMLKDLKHSTKTGLNNMQRRLHLLYENDHVLDIAQTGAMHNVKLQIKNMS